MEPSLTCETCGHQWDPGATQITGCPTCGATTLGFKVDESVEHATDGVRYVGRDRARRKVIQGHAEQRETKSGPLAGTQAWIEQLIDKTAQPPRYKKRVTLSDGTHGKDVDGLLSDQSLHGPQATSGDPAATDDLAN